MGPRQVGKTTLAQQILDVWTGPKHFASADEPTPYPKIWIQSQWERARNLAQQYPNQDILLILDEIQKILDWSSWIKYFWDEDTHHKTPIKVMLLGSSALLMQKGLSESLTGRFEILPVSHWSYSEMRDAFAFSPDQYIYFGGYPGSAPFIEDETRWSRYIQDGMIEPSISKDVLSMTRVDKPALLRQLFEIGCLYSGQIVSMQKVLGKLQDAGNATTLFHYLHLLDQAKLLLGIPKYAGQIVRQRASSPKFQVYNMALFTALAGKDFYNARQDSAYWGRLVESCIGAYLSNQAQQHNLRLYYWREGSYEVDFVVQSGETLIGIEVKSAVYKGRLAGLEIFQKKFKPQKILQIGPQGIPLELFLTTPSIHWF